MAQLFAAPFFTALDANGNPISGGLLKFYASGSLTPQAVYSNDTLATSLGNEVTADSAGRFVPIYLDRELSYRVRVCDAAGTVIRDVDPVGDDIVSAIISARGFTRPEDYASFVDSDTTNNAVAIQAALDYALANDVAVVFGGRRYKTSRLTYRGQTLIGQAQNDTIIQGMPSQDVFYCPDPSISEAGSSGTITYMRVTNLTVEVDNSVAVTLGTGQTFNRPVYPINNSAGTSTAFPINTAVVQRSWYVASGRIYVCMASGTTSGTAPVHTSGVAANGTASFAFIRSAQLYVGNACFAFPYYDGSSALEPFVIEAYFDRVQFRNIVPDTGTNFVNPTCGIYSQRAFYNSHFEVAAYKTMFGVLNVPPTINHYDSQYAPDSNHWVKSLFHCTYPFVQYNGIFNTFNSCQFYGTGGLAGGTTGTVDHEGPHILEYLTATRAYSEGHVFNAYYFEGGDRSATKIESVIMGFGHAFNGGGLTDLSDQPTLFLADGCTFDGFFAGINNTGDPRLLVYGCNNTGTLQTSYDTATSLVMVDYGRANSLSVDFTTFNIYTGRARSLNRGRDESAKFRGDFAHLGLARTPMVNADDLTFTPSELTWVTGTLNTEKAYITKNTAVISGEYVTLPTNGLAYFEVANNAKMIAGINIPRCVCRVSVRVRPGSGTPLQVFDWRATTGTPNIQASPALTLAAGFNVYEFDVDFGLYPVDAPLRFTTNGTTGPVTPVDIADIAIRPIPVQTTPRVSGNSGDAGKTLTVGSSEQTQRWATPLTADRTVTLSATNAMNGDRFKIVRTAASTGAFNLVVGGLKNLAAGQWCVVEYDGAGWILTEAGAL